MRVTQLSGWPERLTDVAGARRRRSILVTVALDRGSSLPRLDDDGRGVPANGRPDHIALREVPRSFGAGRLVIHPHLRPVQARLRGSTASATQNGPRLMPTVVVLASATPFVQHYHIHPIDLMLRTDDLARTSACASPLLLGLGRHDATQSRILPRRRCIYPDEPE